VRAHREEPSAALTASVLHALEADQHRDDACVLAAKLL
jgi:hypothetical protein